MTDFSFITLILISIILLHTHIFGHVLHKKFIKSAIYNLKIYVHIFFSSLDNRSPTVSVKITVIDKKNLIRYLFLFRFSKKYTFKMEGADIKMLRNKISSATKRLNQDYLRLKADPVPYIVAEPLPANWLEWWTSFRLFLIRIFVWSSFLLIFCNVSGIMFYEDLNKALSRVAFITANWRFLEIFLSDHLQYTWLLRTVGLKQTPDCAWVYQVSWCQIL